MSHYNQNVSSIQNNNDIDIEMGYIQLTQDDDITITTVCVICLEYNNDTSIQLECGCNNYYHLDCIHELKKHQIQKCPLCNKIISSTLTTSTTTVRSESCATRVKMFFIAFILTIQSIIYLSMFSIIFFIQPIKLLTMPSNLKYCDNYYIKCEYYQVNAILFNNTINTNIYNFDINYELVSSYKYNDTNKTYICFNLDSINESFQFS